MQGLFEAADPQLHINKLGPIFETESAPLARELGFADPDGPGSCNNLTRERTLGGDGKVTREPGSRYRALHDKDVNPALGITTKTHVLDTSTGEIVAAKDMEGAAHLYNTGSGPTVGYKTVRMAVRSDQTNSTIILSVRSPESKDEAACAVQAANDIKERLPGLLALTYDTALRGTHIAALARQSRLVTIAPVTAKENSAGKRVEKTGFVSSFPHTRPDGIECVHRYHHVGGQLHEEQIDAGGKRLLVPCDDPFIRFQDNKTGHRMYLRWTVLCVAGQAPGSKPAKVGHLDWTVTDEDSSFNVAENLRALPPASSRYREPHGWRQTIENDNHQSDSRKVQGRGRSARPDWNLLNEIGWATMQNGVAVQQDRARRGDATATSPPLDSLPQAA